MRLVIVGVGLDRQTNDSQLIFESPNSTGVDLSQSNLIRNFILIGLPEKEQTQLYESYWSKIEDLFLSRGSAEPGTSGSLEIDGNPCGCRYEYCRFMLASKEVFKRSVIDAHEISFIF